jgi:PAS domain S-box-containing protein
MTMQTLTPNGGWTGYHRTKGDGVAANSITAELIDILDAVDVPIVLVRSDFTIGCFNQAAAEALSLGPSDIGRSPSETSLLTGLLDLEEWCTQAIAAGTPSRHDFRDKHKSYVVQVSPYTRSDRQITGAVLTFTNVTAFRASVDQAIHEREYTKAILNTVAEPLVVLNAALCIESANRAFYAMFQASREETQGVPLSEFRNHSFDLPRLQTQLQQTFADNREFQPFEIDQNFPAIGCRTVILNARPLSLPGHSGRRILLGFQDITERKLAERILRDNENRLRALIEALPAAVYTTDVEGRVTMFNQAAVQFSGRVPELGTDSWCVTWKLYWPDGKPMRHDECPMAQALKEQRPVRDAEAVAERPDGVRIPFIPYPTPLFDASGKLTGAVNMLVDISERKRAEQLLSGHLDEQAALYRFTDRLFRARSPGDVYEAALNTIILALQCQRAAILLFDDTGTMKFVAWRGLSEGYCKAVEGHSPWSSDAQDPAPICIENVETADLDRPLKEAVKAEGIGALAFIPLVAQDQLIGKLMVYYEVPHVFRTADIDLATTIARQLGFSVARMRAEDARRHAQERLEAELADTKLLQSMSAELIQEDEVEGVYDKLLDAVVSVMRSDMASMQALHPERGDRGQLHLLAFRGFDPQAAKFWERVHADSGCSCGEALRTGKRVVVVNVMTCEFMAGTDALAAYLEAGIQAVQSTPLVSRSGKILGMISTYWRNPHQPGERELRLLDILARQAADLIERRQGEAVSRQLASIVDSSDDAIVSKDLTGTIRSWNIGAERLFGYTAEEVIGKSIAILIPADRPNEEPGILERIRRGERIDHYETTRLRKDGTLVDISLTVSPLKDASGKITGASKIARDISERKQAQARQELLTREIYHRTKNLFAVVQAVVSRSFAGKRSVEDAEAAVLDRLHSLAQTHVMLIEKEWQGADIGEVVRAEMGPYAGRVTVEGPQIKLTAKAAQNFALAMHELATNAAKYGALSNSTGRVHISWLVFKQNGSRLFSFCWQERGGPQVTPPTGRGFGSTVLEQVMAEYFETPPQIEFARDGVRYELTGSLDAIAADGGYRDERSYRCSRRSLYSHPRG